jgi:hypothetical protein
MLPEKISKAFYMQPSEPIWEQLPRTLLRVVNDIYAWRVNHPQTILPNPKAVVCILRSIKNLFVELTNQFKGRPPQ